MKRWISLLFAILMTASLFCAAPSASADDEKVMLSVVKTETEFELKLISESSFTLGGIGLSYSYDSNAFSYVKATSTILSLEGNSSENFISLYSGGKVQVTNGTILATITFAANEGFEKTKEYEFSVFFEEAFDYDDDDIAFAETTVSVSYQEEAPAQCEHDWGEWTVTTPATAEADGEETRTCGICGEKETRTYTPQRCAITYDANGGQNAPAAQTVLANEAANLTETAPSREKYNFLGWSEDPDAMAATYQPGAEVNLSDDLTLYAVWAPTELTIQTGATASTITPVVNDTDHSMKVDTSASGSDTSIALSDLTAFASANGADKVELVSGFGANTAPGGTKAQTLVITDGAGNRILEASALGGQLRFDKKMNGDKIVGLYTDTQNKGSALDYADLRLQYSFTLPDGVDVDASTTSWGWELHYGSVTRTVYATNYLPAAGKANTFTSNLVVSNIPLSSLANAERSFSTCMFLNFELNGVTYTIRQANATPLTRSIEALINSYTSNPAGLSAQASAYVTELNKLIACLKDGSAYTPVC